MREKLALYISEVNEQRFHVFNITFFIYWWTWCESHTFNLLNWGKLRKVMLARDQKYGTIPLNLLSRASSVMDWYWTFPLSLSLFPNSGIKWNDVRLQFSCVISWPYTLLFSLVYFLHTSRLFHTQEVFYGVKLLPSGKFFPTLFLLWNKKDWRNPAQYSILNNTCLIWESNGNDFSC